MEWKRINIKFKVMEKLQKIQAELKAPKNQYNSFGKYKYRSCEDILEAVKPLLDQYGCIITLSDEVKEVAGIPYVRAEAIIKDIENVENTFCVYACAGIDINKKGMDSAQAFGSASSYARKYALNGLLLIDDTKDSDSTNNHKEEDLTELRSEVIKLVDKLPLSDQEKLKTIKAVKEGNKSSLLNIKKRALEKLK